MFEQLRRHFTEPTDESTAVFERFIAGLAALIAGLLIFLPAKVKVHDRVLVALITVAAKFLRPRAKKVIDQ